MRMEERKSENETTDFTDFHRCHFGRSQYDPERY
jgi:hypothetical protein